MRLPHYSITHHKEAWLIGIGQKGRRYFRASRSVPGRWFPRDELDPASFAFDMLFGGAKEQSHPRKMGAEAWFDQPEASRYELLEQSFALPGTEVATLLMIEDAAMLEEKDEQRRY